jgi:hypothetical protein
MVLAGNVVQQLGRLPNEVDVLKFRDVQIGARAQTFGELALACFVDGPDAPAVAFGSNRIEGRTDFEDLCRLGRVPAQQAEPIAALHIFQRPARRTGFGGPTGRAPAAARLRIIYGPDRGVRQKIYVIRAVFRPVEEHPEFVLVVAEHAAPESSVSQNETAARENPSLEPSPEQYKLIAPRSKALPDILKSLFVDARASPLRSLRPKPLERNGGPAAYAKSVSYKGSSRASASAGSGPMATAATAAST